jgi:hypothetical protein
MTVEQVNEQASIAWCILAEYAKEKKVLTYGELAKLMNSQFRLKIRMNHRNCKYALGLIQAYCRTHLPAKPPLQSLVVNGTTGKPGKGYTGSRMEEIENEHQRVFLHKWERANSFENWNGPRS